MKPIIAATLLLGAAGLAAPALGQTTTPPQPSPPAATTPAPAPAPRAATPPAGATRVVPAGALEPGANSFTEGQARSRFEEAGFSDIQNLAKDDSGFWRGRGMRHGTAVNIAMDFRGRIAAGPDVVTLPAPATPSTLPRPDASPPAAAPAPNPAAPTPPATPR